ncbi:ABC transporter ATP-binding protein [Thermoanaerobacterium thermosaccharolyticum]|uniref:ABC transporter ATP-binding protein n=1 Tax=Thermoanaerobacterium thermosaccharolyticum TaxID=1517 RepID=A0A223I3H1_THETR|nr:ABC transporter ATP-binding protein [Thermoanaerobacterium thermosaccharolyticum]
MFQNIFYYIYPAMKSLILGIKMAGETRIELATYGFGDRRSTN